MMKGGDGRVKEFFVNKKFRKGNTNSADGERITRIEARKTAKKDFTAEYAEERREKKKSWKTNDANNLKQETRN